MRAAQQDEANFSAAGAPDRQAPLPLLAKQIVRQTEVSLHTLSILAVSDLLVATPEVFCGADKCLCGSSPLTSMYFVRCFL